MNFNQCSVSCNEIWYILFIKYRTFVCTKKIEINNRNVDVNGQQLMAEYLVAAVNLICETNLVPIIKFW
jgi:hypothetical protein